MDLLPNELVDRICCFLESRDLWALVRTSVRYRHLALLPLLSRSNISRSDVEAGTLSLSDSFYLILVVAHIRPIQKLICFRDIGTTGRLRYKTLAAILSITAPIPDILVFNRQYMLQRTRRETVHLLARIPQAEDTTFLIVKGDTTYLSRPRSTPPIRWKLLPPPLDSNTLPKTMKILIVLFGIPLLFAYLVSAIINLGVFMAWAYQRIVGPQWPQDERIIQDAGLLVFDDWMRVQSLPGKFTLVTLTESRRPVLALRPISELSDSVYSSFLSSLDLGGHLQWLTVRANTELALTELLALMQRHPHLTRLFCGPNSIRRSSLIATPIPAESESQITNLAAPATYIPYLLPAAANVEHIDISILPSVKHMPLGRVVFDTTAYRDALTALASLPGTHPLHLALFFHLAGTGLPWHTDVEARDTPETRLIRVHELQLSVEYPARFRAGTIRALAPWLALFPNLTRVSFAKGSVEKMAPVLRMELADVIRAAPGSAVQEVIFNLLDD
ncbi:hypothetical protein FB45DRAFT_888845 [Roridomyces roridus]|uniref:F-box domain-containing protein n=1 Tax=Roridomyces roridus TaxID=1738132 RepID=A0AAD7CKA7_9AGAR|nr:hypothetical protein FB45DRAFT_888845 [Roridomyces roridus]